MNSTMTERFNVAGALLVKLFGRPGGRVRRRSRTGRPGCATSASCRPCTARTFFVALTLVAALATALVYGLGGYYALDRPAGRRHGRHAGAAAVPAVRTADRAVQRPGRRDERAGLASSGSSRCSTSQPMIADAPDARDAAGRRALDRVRRRALLATRPPPRCRSPRWRTSRCSTRRPRRRCCTTCRSPPRPGELVALVGPSGAGKTTISQLVPRLYDVRAGRGPGRRRRRPRRRPWPRCATAIGVVTQDAHLFHDTIRANLRYARPEATEAEMWAGAGGRPDRRSGRARCRTGWTPWSATAATGCPAARSSGWRSPGCCSRRRRIVILDEATAHLDSRVGGRGAAGAGHGAGGPDLAGDRAPAVHGARRGQDPRRGRRPDRASRAPTPSCSPPAACTPSSTAPSSSGSGSPTSRSPTGQPPRRPASARPSRCRSRRSASPARTPPRLADAGLRERPGPVR